LNIHYIRAAIEQRTGIRLDLDEVRDLLVEEKLITPARASHVIFKGYSDFYPYFYKHDRNVIEATHKTPTPLDTYRYMKEFNGETKKPNKELQ